MGIFSAVVQPVIRPVVAQETRATEAAEALVVFAIVEQPKLTADVHLPARIHLKSTSGQAVQPAGYPSWNDHFVCDGTARFTLPEGEYSFEVERGPEYQIAKGRFAVVDTAPARIEVTLERLVDLGAEGWWSGDLHIHRSLDEAEMLMRAEDLHIAQFTSWWNRSNPWDSQALPAALPMRMDGNRFYHSLAGEDERDGGALLYFNLDRPLNITGGTRHYPSSMVFVREARQRRGGWIEIEKPFWWDFPMWLAHGVGDSVGIAHNHLQRSGVLDNEAWGRPRDRSRYPGIDGNGLYTQEIYFHALNCGFRLPPSAGSASGVLPNPVGYNRVYVFVDGELTWDKWWDGLRTGRSFVSNGPLLRAHANGEWPGHIFKSAGPLQVRLDARLDSREPIRSVDLIRNGRVERLSLPASFTCHESEWFALRAIADATNTLRFAMTAPWYVEIDEQPIRVREESARFFLDWTRDRISTLQQLAEMDAGQKTELLEPWRETLLFWQGKVSEAVNFRPPKDDADLRFWLENMLQYHGFSYAEAGAATGLASEEIAKAAQRFGLLELAVPARAPGSNLRVLPYPGGRHPRIGFLEGAVAPQRDTKISVFAPWDESSYVVADIPEAIWSNLGLTYLAHSHIETLWSRQDLVLPPVEWNRRADGTLDFERTLPNGIGFGTRVVPGPASVLMESWIRNGTGETLTQLRLQNCVMLKGVSEFALQSDVNKIFRGPYAACRSEDGKRWVITAWDPLDATWQNPNVPCIHSNGRLADCPPGATVRARGWLSFYEGTDIQAELDRIDRQHWR